MMHKIVCLALGHRLRVVQEFSPQCRRIKCDRCGGDWGMSDAHDGFGIKAAVVEWQPDFEQFFRDIGFEILEPLPAWRSVAVEPLTWGELLRAVRWPGVITVTVSGIVGHTLLITSGDLLGLLASMAISYALGRFLGQRAIDRAYERKCNSLRA